MPGSSMFCVCVCPYSVVVVGGYFGVGWVGCWGGWVGGGLRVGGGGGGGGGGR